MVQVQASPADSPPLLPQARGWFSPRLASPRLASPRLAPSACSIACALQRPAVLSTYHPHFQVAYTWYHSPCAQGRTVTAAACGATSSARPSRRMGAARCPTHCRELHAAASFRPSLPHLHRDCTGSGLGPATSWDWAHCCHICIGTTLAPPTSARGLGPPLPHLHLGLPPLPDLLALGSPAPPSSATKDPPAPAAQATARCAAVTSPTAGGQCARFATPSGAHVPQAVARAESCAAQHAEEEAADGHRPRVAAVQCQGGQLRYQCHQPHEESSEPGEEPAHEPQRCAPWWYPANAEAAATSPSGKGR